MSSRKKRATLAMLVILPAALAVWGFGLRPDSTTLSIHVETIADEEGVFHRRWIFESGRRWASYGTGFRPGEHFVVLDPPGTMDSGPIRFLKEVAGQGADRIVYEIEARRSTTPGEVITERSLLGNAGGTPAFSAVSTESMPVGTWESQFRAIQTQDARIPLPAKLKLGVIGGSSEMIEFR